MLREPEGGPPPIGAVALLELAELLEEIEPIADRQNVYQRPLGSAFLGVGVISVAGATSFKRGVRLRAHQSAAVRLLNHVSSTSSEIASARSRPTFGTAFSSSRVAVAIARSLSKWCAISKLVRSPML